MFLLSNLEYFSVKDRNMGKLVATSATRNKETKAVPK